MTCADVRLNAGLFRSSSCNELAGIDERKRLGIVAALKVDRLALGAVDVNRLARVRLTRTRAAKSPLSSARSHTTTLMERWPPPGS